MITDCHIHIQPMEMFKPHALELMKNKRANFEQISEFCRSPKAFLKYLDDCGVDRAVLINYVAPEVIGFTNGVNQFIAAFMRKPASATYHERPGRYGTDCPARNSHDQDSPSAPASVSE
jgi:hypothetical protein